MREDHLHAHDSEHCADHSKPQNDGDKCAGVYPRLSVEREQWMESSLGSNEKCKMKSASGKNRHAFHFSLYMFHSYTRSAAVRRLATALAARNITTAKTMLTARIIPHPGSAEMALESRR